MTPEELTLPAVLRRQADQFGRKTLVRSGDGSWSYQEAPLQASRFAHGLYAAGLQPGDRIAVMCQNRLDVLRIWLGAGWAGIVMVPVNTALRAAQLEHVLVNSRVRVLVIERELLELLDF